MPDSNEILTKEDKVKIKSCIYALQRDGLPPVTTHNVIDDYKDPVLNALRRCRLFNTVHDHVKVSQKNPCKSKIYNSELQFYWAKILISGCFSS